MNTKIHTALCLVTGLIGGAMSHYLFFPMPARAQASVPPPAEIRAQKFELVDGNGTPSGVFGFQSDGSPVIQIRVEQQPKGLAKLTKAEAGVRSARWFGISDKNVLPDLKPAHP